MKYLLIVCYKFRRSTFTFVYTSTPIECMRTQNTEITYYLMCAQIQLNHQK